MRSQSRVLALTLALACASPLLAEELVVSDLKAFSARADAAAARCDVDSVVGLIAEPAILQGVGYNQGQMLRFRMNKTQYRELLTRICAARSDYRHERTNEKISIEGDQAIITADVAETLVLAGQPIATKTRERVTVELIDGRLMVTQLVSNEVP